MKILNCYSLQAIALSLLFSVFQVAHAKDYVLGNGMDVIEIIMPIDYYYKNTQEREWEQISNEGVTTQVFQLVKRGYRWIILREVENSDAYVSFDFRSGAVRSFTVGAGSGTPLGDMYSVVNR